MRGGISTVALIIFLAALMYVDGDKVITAFVEGDIVTKVIMLLLLLFLFRMTFCKKNKGSNK